VGTGSRFVYKEKEEEREVKRVPPLILSPAAMTRVFS
jgi:hypothetical protein